MLRHSGNQLYAWSVHNRRLEAAEKVWPLKGTGFSPYRLQPGFSP